MECDRCSGQMSEETGTLRLDDPYVGRITIPNVPFFKCKECLEYAYPLETAREIERARQSATIRAIKKFPIEEFVSSAEAAKYLGISRQALNKNRRIKRGFVYKTKIGDGCVLYLHRSLVQYKEDIEKHDGRFPMFPVWNMEAPQYAGYPTEWRRPIDNNTETLTKLGGYTYTTQLKTIQETVYARKRNREPNSTQHVYTDTGL
jgi:hypothetical protein